MPILDRTTLPDCGPYIRLYQLDVPLRVVGLVYRQVDASRLFMELPLDVFEGICVLTRGTPPPFDEYEDRQFVLSPAPSPPPPDCDLFGPDGGFRPVPIPPPPDGALDDLAADLDRWCEVLMAVESAAFEQMAYVYPRPAPCSGRVKADVVETVSYLAARVRQVVRRQGAIAISGV